MCTDTAIEPDQSDSGKLSSAVARPTGISGVSPKHLAVGSQPLPHSSSSEDIDNNSDDQVDIRIGVNCGERQCALVTKSLGFLCKLFSTFCTYFYDLSKILASLHSAVLMSRNKCNVFNDIVFSGFSFSCH